MERILDFENVHEDILYCENAIMLDRINGTILDYEGVSPRRWSRARSQPIGGVQG